MDPGLTCLSSLTLPNATSDVPPFRKWIVIFHVDAVANDSELDMPSKVCTPKGQRLPDRARNSVSWTGPFARYLQLHPDEESRSSISGLLRGFPLAPMKTADPHLIPKAGLVAQGQIQVSWVPV